MATRSRAPTTDISSPHAIIPCCCSIGKATAWRRNSGPATCTAPTIGTNYLPEIERQQKHGKEVVVRADAAFAKPETHEALESRGVNYAIRIPANENLERDIA